ncbi:MAG: ribosome biogenesis GTP-binding protein YihA/YsxC [Eubacteriales bacterium]|nr:ribosome biogenesis GTP-binding protein YihA/YsxC [Eubacteriales bacterium]
MNRAELRVSAGRTDQFPKDAVPQIAFSGRSNVGKSSLINCLLGRKSLARVSGTPGKTVTINFYDVDKKLFLVDLPGYGYARRSGEKRQVFSSLTDSYFTANPLGDRLRLVVQLVDSRVGPTDDDTMMMQWLLDNGIPFIVALTKADKLKPRELAEILDNLQHEFFHDVSVEVIPFSSVTREGKDALWERILRVL